MPYSKIQKKTQYLIERRKIHLLQLKGIPILVGSMKLMRLRMSASTVWVKSTSILKPLEYVWLTPGISNFENISLEKLSQKLFVFFLISVHLIGSFVLKTKFNFLQLNRDCRFLQAAALE